MTEGFCRLLDEAIKDEQEAPRMYFKLKRELSKKQLDKYDVLTDKVLDTIIDAETSHLNLLKTIKRHVCKVEE